METNHTNLLAVARPVCWCGEANLEPYSAEYLRCNSCCTLVSLAKSTVTDSAVHDDETDFYGKDYWLGHQKEQLGLPSIEVRARKDYPERCVYWLRHLLRLQPPPARVLDVGCAHGAFVSLLRHAGYDASGVEVSPWVVEFARNTFDIPVHQGPVEQQTIAEGSFDAIVLHDVVEHLPDPVGTLAHCKRLLKPDGVLIIQMPAYPEGMSHDDLVKRKDLFLPLMESMAREHLHLFSQRAAARMLEQLGFRAQQFLTPIFPHDMYVAASRAVLNVREPDSSPLLGPAARLVQALLDLDMRLQNVEADRAARLNAIQWQKGVNQQCEAARQALEAQLLTLSAPPQSLPRQGRLARLPRALWRLARSAVRGRS